MACRFRSPRPSVLFDRGLVLRLLLGISLVAASCTVDSGTLEASLSDIEVLGEVETPTSEPAVGDEGSSDDPDGSDGPESTDEPGTAALGFRFLPDAEADRATATVGFELVAASEAGPDEATGAAAEVAEVVDEAAVDADDSADDPDAPEDAGDTADSESDQGTSQASSDDDALSDEPDPADPPAPPASNTIDDLPWGPGSSVWVATAKPETGYVQVFDGPDGTPITPQYEYLDGTTTAYPMWNPTYFGGPLSFMVVNGVPEDGYVEVQLPIRPTGSTGWVRTAEFDFLVNDYYVEIDIATNRVRAWKGEELIIESAAVTGRSDRPTPLVRTYIDEKLPGPNSAYGPWMLTLAAFSDSLNTFGSAGGLPKLAMHGTDSPQLMGQYASSGCIRLPNDIITLIAEAVPVGTRVDIVRSS